MIKSALDVHHIDNGLLRRRDIKHLRFRLFGIKLVFPYTFEVRSVDQHQISLNVDASGREQVLDHAVRSIFDPSIDLVPRFFRFRDEVRFPQFFAEDRHDALAQVDVVADVNPVGVREFVRGFSRPHFGCISV